MKINFNEVEKGLESEKQDQVSIYLSYLKFLSEEKDKDGKSKNAWFFYFETSAAISMFKAVAKDGVYIDGESITLQYKGKVLVSYNYQAYKNRLLNVYPETKFDIQLVYENDNFSFKKESGKVIYSHSINDPFAINKKIIGAYCIIKNNRGEFLETINIEDINNFKASAKTKKVWDAWFSEMVLKSVIKRACKRHFKDVTCNMDKIDNELSDPGLVTIDEVIQRKIENTKTIADLNKAYKEEINNVSDKMKLIDLCSERKNEIRESLPELNDEDFKKALDMIKAGSKLETLLDIWKIDEDTQNELLIQAS